MNESVLANLNLLAQYSENQNRDFFVALVAIGLGVSIVYAAFTENQRCYSLGSVSSMERNYGRPFARFILYVIGGLCLAMGVYLVTQTATNRKLIKASPDSENRMAIAGVNVVAG